MTIALVPPAPASARSADPPDLRAPAYLRGAGRFLIHYLKLRKGRFGAVAAAVAIAATCTVGVQYGLKLMVDALTGPRDAGAVGGALGVFLGLILVEAVFWRVGGWLSCSVTVATGVDIRADVFDHVTGHPQSYFQNQRAGALGHRITALAGNFGALANRLTWDVAPPVINFVGALAIFAALDLRLAAGVALLTLAITAGLIVIGLRGGALHEAHAAESGRVGGELMDVLANIWSVKAFSARTRERARLADAFEQEARSHRRAWLFNEKIRIVNDVALVVTAGLTLLGALWLWRERVITAGDVVLICTLTFRLLHGSRDLAIALMAVAQNYAYVGETLEALGGAHEVADAPDARPLIRCGGAVRLEGVRFAYAAGRPVLRRLTLDVPAGQKLGLVGPSGAGKSTVLSLLQRLYDPDEGRLLVDGQAISRLRQDDLRAALSVVPQEVALFHRSVAENIRFARPGATDEEVRHAARAAYCEDFIDELSEGYDTLVGERGAKLSGGQRQRLGVARALLKDAPIVLLDEATSALDSESELEVQRAIDRLMYGRTVIAVAHRLSTLTDFDRIVVMQGGRIVEDGAPLELRARRGVFEHMWRLQVVGLEAPAPPRLAAAAMR